MQEKLENNNFKKNTWKNIFYFSKVGMETDKTVREGTKRYMIGDINSRKDCIKTMTYSSCKFLTPVTYYIAQWLTLLNK